MKMKSDYIFYTREDKELRGAIAIRVEDGAIWVGGSLCADGDQFSRKIARAIAFGRLTALQEGMGVVHFGIRKTIPHTEVYSIEEWETVTFNELIYTLVLDFQTSSKGNLARQNRFAQYNNDRFANFRDVIARRGKRTTDEVIDTTKDADNS